MTGMLTLAVESLLAVALAVVAYLCWRMDRRLNDLRAGRDDAMKSAASLMEAIAQAERAVQGLRATSTQVGPELQRQIDEARTVAGELEFLVGAGQRQLGAATQPRTPPVKPVEPMRVPEVAAAPPPEPVSRAVVRNRPNWADLR